MLFSRRQKIFTGNHISFCFIFQCKPCIFCNLSAFLPSYSILLQPFCLFGFCNCLAESSAGAVKINSASSLICLFFSTGLVVAHFSGLYAASLVKLQYIYANNINRTVSAALLIINIACWMIAMNKPIYTFFLPGLLINTLFAF